MRLGCGGGLCLCVEDSPAGVGCPGTRWSAGFCDELDGALDCVPDCGCGASGISAEAVRAGEESVACDHACKGVPINKSEEKRVTAKKTKRIRSPIALPMLARHSRYKKAQNSNGMNRERLCRKPAGAISVRDAPMCQPDRRRFSCYVRRDSGGRRLRNAVGHGKKPLTGGRERAHGSWIDC